MCCLLPMGAGAVVVNPESGQQSVSTTDSAWQNAVSSGSTITINSGNGLLAIGRGASGDADYVAGGFSVAGNMYVGVPSDQGSISGDLYVLNTTANPFTVISTGDVSIGSILQVLGGKTLAFKSNDPSSAFTLTVGSNQVNEGIKVGDNTQSASLVLENIDVLTVNGSVITYGDMTVDANLALMGQVNVNAGDFSVVANAVEMAGLVSGTDQDVNVSANNYISVSGTVQNNAGDMTLAVDATGGRAAVTPNGIDISGSLENKSSGNMDVVATGGANLRVGGIVSNEDSASTMTIDVNNLSVDGSVDGYSLVNNGVFHGNVAGVTYLFDGWNLNNGNLDADFYLATGSLEIADDTAWQSAFANNLNDFQLYVRDSGLYLGQYNADIVNGAKGNKGANMVVAAQSVDVNRIQNNGASLSVLAGTDAVNPNSGAGDYGNLTVNDFVSGVAGSQTQLIASGTLGVNGDITNQGQMLLNANQVAIMLNGASGTGNLYGDTVSALPNGDVLNTGANAQLTIMASNTGDGTVAISGDVTNSGQLVDISAKNIAVAGVVTNNTGVMNIRGSYAEGDTGADLMGPVFFGSLVANGGVLNIDAQGGAIQVANAIKVAQDGALNFEENVKNVDVSADGTGIVQIAGNVTAGDMIATGGGNVNVATTGAEAFQLSANQVVVGGGISVVDANVARSLKLVADKSIAVGEDVFVANQGMLSLGAGIGGSSSGSIDIDGGFNVADGGVAAIYADEAIVGSLNVDNAKMISAGNGLLADNGDIDITGALYVQSSVDPEADLDLPANGFSVTGTVPYVMQTTAEGADIRVGSVFVAENMDLTLESADDFVVAGDIDNSGVMNVTAGGLVTVGGAFTNLDSWNLSAQSLQMMSLDNQGDAEFLTTDAGMVFANIDNAGSLKLTSAGDITALDIVQLSGVVDVSANSLNARSLVAQDQVNIMADSVRFSSNVTVSGDLVHGGTSGMLNVDATQFNAYNLSVRGGFVAEAGNATYDVTGSVRVSGDVSVADGVDLTVKAGRDFEALNLTNAGLSAFSAQQGVTLGNIINDSGTLMIDSGVGMLDFATLTMNSGNLLLDGAGMTMTGAIATGASLYQGYNGSLSVNDINVVAQDYEITTSSIDVAQIKQSGKLVVNTSDVDVAGDIVATDLRFAAQLGDIWAFDDPELPWLMVDVAGDVSGGVEFIGLEKMHVGGNYIFDQNSILNAVVLPYASAAGSTDVNYWSTVNLTDDNTLGGITNAEDGRALVLVDGKFTSGAQFDSASLGVDPFGGKLADGQIGINLFDVVDQGTAIWLLYADKGVENFSLLEQMRNLDVKFCNADGSLCYNYLDSLRVKNDIDVNGTDEDLPAYISVRDVNGDGQADSLYVVFDPRFGGPVLLEDLKIQSIVAREPDYTNGEYVSAGALDDLLIGQAHNKKFWNGAPLEIVPIIFDGTNMQEMANELYNRMEYYVENADGSGLARFSRLFQAREIELLSGAVALNEHTSFRSFEDRMFDEFIWNRNRQLKKAWVDVDYGMFYQDIDDAKHTDGNRFSISGGFDWQETDTLVLGLTGRISHSAASADDAMDLGYLPGESIDGHVMFDVADTNIGMGGYLMKTLGEKMRLYGNAFLDIHMFDIDRNQNFVDTIDGEGAAFSLISEWGLMHDILNQYIVGNAYARTGYNFGFNVKEHVQGKEYMRLKSDGYFILTPGYSVTAQKKIYPSAWLQIRPYASVGVEYDVLGAPDFAKYKFAPAEKYTEYNINIDPLWVNIGGGVEVLSAYGVQMGLDYRYQYNNDIQLHNIRVSGSYRF